MFEQETIVQNQNPIERKEVEKEKELKQVSRK
jgi:hypothetical protein